MNQAILDVIDAAAKRYNMTTLARELGKGEITLRNELIGVEGSKLGFFQGVEIIRKTRCYEALDWAEAECGRIAHKLPRVTGVGFAELAALAGESAVEFGQHVIEFGKAMRDGKISKKEGEKWLTELREANAKGLELQATLEGYLKRCS